MRDETKRTMPSRSPAPRVREVLRELLAERGLTLRGFAAQIGVSQPHLTNVVHGKKEPTGELARRVASGLELPEDFFAEAREAAVIDAMRNDPPLRERLYRLVQSH